MQAFTRLEGRVLPIDRANVDTDAIIPKQFMKSVRRTGFGPYLFDEWRYLDHGEPGQDCSRRPLNPQCVLNEPRYQGARILLARSNFGCGSSREHAPWALSDWGIRALIAPSFADIFLGNCFKNGLLAIELDEPVVDALFQSTFATVGYSLNVDLDTQTITRPDGPAISFQVDAHRRRCLLEGLDEIALTLAQDPAIDAYEQRRRQLEPWLF
jgi:3-isopropylmalate/(R)-2-methylmalate dehydratase small subunit